MNDRLSPYIDHGPNKGRINDPLVAHEFANKINDLVDNKFSASGGWLTQLIHRVTHARQRYAISQATEAGHMQAIDSVVRERTDPLTGLGNKEAYHQDRISLIRSLEEDDEIIIARIDMGLLNYFNQVRGHVVGDQYLKAAGTLIDGKTFEDIKKLFSTCAFAKGYHESGDEFIILLKTKKKSASNMSVLVEKALKTGMHMLDLPGGDLVLGDDKPYKLGREMLLDIGFSTFSEGKPILDNLMRYVDQTHESDLRALSAEVTDRIADVRTDIRKAKKRIVFLKSLFEENRTLFHQIYPYAAKGALAVSDQDFTKLLSKDSIEAFITHIFASRLGNDALRETDSFQSALQNYLATSMKDFVKENEHV